MESLLKLAHTSKKGQRYFAGLVYIGLRITTTLAGSAGMHRRAFGQAEARIVMARLLRTHTFEFTDHKIHAHMGATLEPRPGVRMKISKRTSAAVPGGEDAA